MTFVSEGPEGTAPAQWVVGQREGAPESEFLCMEGLRAMAVALRGAEYAAGFIDGLTGASMSRPSTIPYVEGLEDGWHVRRELDVADQVPH